VGPGEEKKKTILKFKTEMFLVQKSTKFLQEIDKINKNTMHQESLEKLL